MKIVRVRVIAPTPKNVQFSICACMFLRFACSHSNSRFFCWRANKNNVFDESSRSFCHIISSSKLSLTDASACSENEKMSCTKGQIIFSSSSAYYYAGLDSPRISFWIFIPSQNLYRYPLHSSRPTTTFLNKPRKQAGLGWTQKGWFFSQRSCDGGIRQRTGSKGSWWQSQLFLVVMEMRK